MTIEEMKQRKRAAEQRLASFISEAVTAFQTETGMHVTHVAVNLANATAIGGQRNSIVTGVEIDVEL